MIDWPLWILAILWIAGTGCLVMTALTIIAVSVSVREEYTDEPNGSDPGRNPPVMAGDNGEGC